MRRLLIQGSARSAGNTHLMLDTLQQQGWDADRIDLLDYTIHPYTYDHRHRDDDFLPLLRDIVEHYDLLLFATPVYWYTMSGLLKDFFDRISDALQIEKPTGRRLRGMYLAMLSCGTEPEPVEGFSVPFRESADYLGMHYAGEVHTWAENDGILLPVVREKLLTFAAGLVALEANTGKNRT